MKIQGNKPPESQEISRQISQRPVAPASKERTAPAEKTTGAEKTSGAEKTAARDRIDISSKSKEVADLMATIEKMPDVRQEKIDALREAIRAGKYNADPSKIAEGILRDI